MNIQHDYAATTPKAPQATKTGLSTSDVNRMLSNVGAFVLLNQPRYERESIQAYKDVLAMEDELRREGENDPNA